MAPRKLIQTLLASEYFVLILTALYFLALWPFTPQLGSWRNIQHIFSNMLPLLVVAIGQTFVLITAGIDLSVTAVIAFASVVGASLITRDGGVLAGSFLAVPVSVLAMLAVGLAIGGLNGAAVAWLKMPPFIVTLTTMMFFSGFAVLFTRSNKIANLDPAFITLGAGGVGGIPNALVIAAVLAAAAHIILSRTPTGRRLYAVGHNIKSAAVSGVPVTQTILFAYLVSGFCAALASVLYTARLETGDPELGERILLDIIGATVIGGTSLFGGKGKISWTVFGVLFFTLLDNSLNIRGYSHFTIQIIKGAVILLAALLDTLRNRWLAAT